MKKSVKSSGVISVKGECKTCGKTWLSGAVALDAIRHHQATGHAVYVEQSASGGGRQTKKAPPSTGRA